MNYQGAEATVEITDKVLKNRNPKNYRHPDLDERIRKERTEKEKRLLKEAAKNGVKVPQVEKKSEDKLELEKIEGETLKSVLSQDKELSKDLGKNVAKLHQADIIHNDLTTSNVICFRDEIYLIDFGLSFRSERIEDKAVDLHLFKQVLESSHPNISQEIWEKFLEGYSILDESEEIEDQLEEVESRGRYK